jgi:uncharacterized repeat protein (TIGR01451 family)
MNMRKELLVSSRQLAVGRGSSSKKLSVLIALAFILAANCLLQTASYAKGVTSNTVITQPTANLSLTFLNGVAQSFTATPFNTNLSKTVQVVYGISLNSKEILKNTTAGVSTNLFTQNFRNVSNATANYKAYANSYFVTGNSLKNPGTLANWRHAFLNYSVTSNVPHETNFIFQSEIRPAVNALNASRAAVTTNFALLGVLGDAYTGFDDSNYGGATTINIIIEAEINGPDMKMISRTSTVNAPAGFSGDPHAAVPGAMVSYNIVLQNQGTATANSVNIVDRIPNATTYYSTVGNLNDGAGISAFICLNGSNTPIACAINTPAIARVKFDVGNVLPGKYVTLNYAVVIK